MAARPAAWAGLIHVSDKAWLRALVVVLGLIDGFALTVVVIVFVLPLLGVGSRTMTLAMENRTARPIAVTIGAQPSPVVLDPGATRTAAFNDRRSPDRVVVSAPDSVSGIAIDFGGRIGRNDLTLSIEEAPAGTSSVDQTGGPSGN